MAIDIEAFSVSDPRFGAPVVFVSLPRHEVNYFKVLLESYEGIAAFRTQNPEHEPGRALVAILLAPDASADVAAVLVETIETAAVTLYRPSAADLDALEAALFSDAVEDPG